MIAVKGMVLLAIVLCASAIGATAAQAAAFHVEGEEATITGGYAAESPSEKELVTFTVENHTVPCLKASFSGSTPKTAESLTLQATLGECFAWSLTMGGCHFRLDASGTLHIEGGVACEAEPIELEPNVGCTVQIGPQTRSGVSFTNNGSGSKRDITATFSVTGLHYIQLNAFCQGGKGTFENGKLTGIVTLRADQPEGGAQQGLWFE